MRAEKKIEMLGRFGLCAESTRRNPHRGHLHGAIGITTKDGERLERVQFRLCFRHAAQTAQLMAEKGVEVVVGGTPVKAER